MIKLAEDLDGRPEAKLATRVLANLGYAAGDHPASSLENAFLAKMLGDPIDDLVQRSLWTEPGEGVQLVHAWDTPHHVFKSRFVGLIIGNIFDGGRTGSSFFNAVGQVFNRYFFGVSNVDHFAYSALGAHEAN